jgi:hypothetical protein
MFKSTKSGKDAKHTVDKTKQSQSRNRRRLCADISIVAKSRENSESSKRVAKKIGHVPLGGDHVWYPED